MLQSLNGEHVEGLAGCRWRVYKESSIRIETVSKMVNLEID